jgi:hypothetical protein
MHAWLHLLMADAAEAPATSATTAHCRTATASAQNPRTRKSDHQMPCKTVCDVDTAAWCRHNQYAAPIDHQGS